MSIVHMDNFSMYGTTKGYLLNGVYASIGGTAGGVGTDGVELTADPDGISAGVVFELIGDSYGGANNKSHIRYVLATPSDVLGIASRMWLANLPITDLMVPGPHQFNDGSNNPITTLTVDTTGRFTLRSGDWNGAELGSSDGPVVTANGWYHVETWIDIGAGTAEVRVEGIPVIELTGIDLGADDVAQVNVIDRPTGASSGVTMYLKDLIIMDDSGTHNTTFIGTCLVVSLVPNGDTSLNWTPTGAANGWSILDNSPPQDGVMYITAPNPPPAAYVGTLTDLPPDVTSVKGLMSMVRAAKTDGGDANLQVGIKSAVATDLGADRPITVAQTYWRDVSEEDPDTMAPWTVNATNAAKIQLNRTV